MKNNKAFMGMGIVILILAISVLGGVAYYFSKNIKPQAQDVPEAQITFPIAGTTLIEGNTYNITWININNTNVTYGLYLENDQVGSIRIGETSQKSFSWKVPSILDYMNGGDGVSSVAPADGYKISITDLSNSKKFYSQIFKIISSRASGDGEFNTYINKIYSINEKTFIDADYFVTLDGKGAVIKDLSDTKNGCMARRSDLFNLKSELISRITSMSDDLDIFETQYHAFEEQYNIHCFPNGIWVDVNDNPKIRTLQISNDITINTETLLTPYVDSRVTTLQQFKNAFKNPVISHVLNVPFSIVIENGLVTKIKEIYHP